MRPYQLAISALAAVLCLGSLPSSRAVHCSSYLTCADCACSTFDYGMYDDCNEGCAWLPESGECVAASEISGDESTGIATSSAITSLFMTDGMDTEAARVAQLKQGRVRCPLEKSWFKQLLIKLALVGLAIAYSYSFLHYAAPRWWFTGSMDAVQDALKSAKPAREAVLWQATAQPRYAGDGLGPLLLLATGIFGVIPGLWLYYGIPPTIDPTWDAAFFVPLGVGGGVAYLVLMLFVVLGGAPRGRAVTGYMLTRTCFVKVVGRARRGGQAADIARLSTATIEKVYSVSMHGDSVNFVARCFIPSELGSSAEYMLPTGRQSLWLWGLKDAQQAFKVLEEMRSSAEEGEVMAALAVAEPVAMVKVEQPMLGRRSVGNAHQ